jgi:hypothetical protein
MSAFRATGGIVTIGVDNTAGTLSLGTSFATNVNIGQTAVGTTTVNNALTSTGILTGSAGIKTNSLDRASAGELSLGTATATSVSIGKTATGTTTINNALTATGLTTANGGLTIGGSNNITLSSSRPLPTVGQLGYVYTSNIVGGSTLTAIIDITVPGTYMLTYGLSGAYTTISAVSFSFQGANTISATNMGYSIIQPGVNWSASQTQIVNCTASAYSIGTYVVATGFTFGSSPTSYFQAVRIA